MYKFNIDKYDLNIEQPTSDSENWYVIKQQSFTINKEEFLVDKFNKDFAKYSVKDFDQLKDICNQSIYLRDWYAKTSLLYAQSIQLPVFLKEIVSAPEYEGLANKLQQYNSIIAKKSREIEELSSKFDKDRDNIESKYHKEYSLLLKDKIVRILCMTIEDLPILLQLEISNFTPSTKDSAPNRSSYGRELLLNYQRTLITLVKDNPDVDIDSIINEMRSK